MGTKFNFKSQICTSRSQSEKLLALGLKKGTADCYRWQENDQYGDGNGKWHLEVLDTKEAREHFEYLDKIFDDELFIPAWSLHRLLSMLPDNAPRMFWILDGANISIELDNDGTDFFPHKGNMYNGLINCIEWLIKEGYFNKEYLV